jgi:4-hydroxy-3-polyprenylbenzoate decarboxylase
MTSSRDKESGDSETSGGGGGIRPIEGQTRFQGDERVVVAVTGASGVAYAQRLVRRLLELGMEVHLIVSAAARVVLREELGANIGRDPWGETHRERLILHSERDFAAPYCSGSWRHRGLVICPASLGTVGALASGVSANGIHRAAEVALKERRRLVVVPRETPLSQIQLSNLLELSRAGALILPAAPAFYQKPTSIEDLLDFIVSRILDALEIPNELYERWSGLPPTRDRHAGAENSEGER